MAAVLHHRLTAQPNLNKVLVWSFLLHVAVLVAISLSFSTRIRISAPAIQVKLVGVPQPTAAAKPVVPEKIRTQDSAAPKEPPPEMKNIPPSDATTKFVTEQKPPEDKKVNPIEAKERPPTLDKTPREKKVVKNDLDAKVVKNPEDFLDSIDKLLEKEKTTAKPTPEAKPEDKPAGDGPQLQLNMTDDGVNSAIAAKVNKNWVFQPGADFKGLSVVVQISLAPDGQLTRLQVSQSSGNKPFDDSLLRAIRKSLPLPIPPDKAGAYVDFEMAFSQ